VKTVMQQSLFKIHGGDLVPLMAGSVSPCCIFAGAAVHFRRRPGAAGTTSKRETGLINEAMDGVSTGAPLSYMRGIGSAAR